MLLAKRKFEMEIENTRGFAKAALKAAARVLQQLAYDRIGYDSPPMRILLYQG